ncbi:MAG: tetratricopeptide repeat protein [Caldilineaceae bacterium]
MIEVATIRQVLRAWHSPQIIAQSDLALLNCVRLPEQQRQRTHSPAELAATIRNFLRRGIDSLQPRDSQLVYTDRRWWPYILLKERYIDGRDDDYLQVQMQIGSRRTFQIHCRDALQQLVTILQDIEEQSLSDTPLDMAHSPFLAPPKPSYTLVGRYLLVEQLIDRLLKPEINFMALFGIPGVGKTALALEITHDARILSRFYDGILWAGLGRSPDVLAILGTWARTLKMPPQSLNNLTTIESSARALQQHIGQRQVLIVLDDVWQLEAALNLTVGGPRCTYLLTTRNPDIAQDYAEAEAVVVQELTEAGGQTLFTQLAPELAQRAPQEVMNLIKLVGALPLAIILVARYARKLFRDDKLTIHEGLARLSRFEERLKLVQPVSVLGRHPSLAASAAVSLPSVLDISIDALQASELTVIRALCILPPKPNTFHLQAALSICQQGAEQLTRLVESGLIEAMGNQRYAIHQAIHDYIMSTLPAAKEIDTLVSTYVSFATKYERDFARLAPEMENIGAILAYAQRSFLRTEYVELIRRYAYYLETRGLYDLVLHYLSAAEEIARATLQPLVLIDILFQLGKNFDRTGKYAHAERYYQEALILANAQHAEDEISKLLGSLGRLKEYSGEYEEAARLHRASLDIARKLRLPTRIRDGLLNLGIIVEKLGDMEQAKSLYLEGLALIRQIDNGRELCNALINIGGFSVDVGDYIQGEVYLLEALDVAKRIDFRSSMTAILNNLSAAAAARGDFAKQEAYLREGLELAKEIQERQSMVIGLGNLATLEVLRQNYQKAENYGREALSIARELQDPERIAQTLNILGDIAIKTGECDLAAHYINESLSLARESDNQRTTAQALNVQGRLYLAQNNFIQAHEAFDAALDLAKAASLSELAGYAHFGLAQVKAGLMELAAARQHGEMSRKLFSQIMHRETAQVEQWLHQLPKP